MRAKQIITALIVGLIGGLGGALIFEPIDGFLDVLFSDYTIGGVIIGGITAIRNKTGLTLGKLILNCVVIGLIVFLVFGLISGKIVDDLIAGAIIGLFVALAVHFLTPKVKSAVDVVDEKIDELTD